PGDSLLLVADMPTVRHFYRSTASEVSQRELRRALQTVLDSLDLKVPIDGIMTPVARETLERLVPGLAPRSLELHDATLWEALHAALTRDAARTTRPVVLVLRPSARTQQRVLRG